MQPLQTDTTTAHPWLLQERMLVEIHLLDGSPLQVDISSKSSGDDLLEEVARNINLLEKDYFGFIHFDKKDRDGSAMPLWVQNDRNLKKQLKEPHKVWFQVRFYPPDPAQLQEDLTRYQLCLQIQQDVKSGKLPCSFVTHALLGAYLAQSELGDYDPVDHGLTSDYIRDFDFAPSQSEDLLERIMEVHKTLKGQSPAEAELHYLDNAKKLAMYGVSLHPARDSEGVDIMLGVCSSGILVYRDRLRINRFAWPKIIKISYKRNGFYIKIRPGEFEHFESTVGFKLESHKSAKRLWKICVEHHSFFRLLSPDQKEKPKFPRFGSKFRYSGRTQHQAKKNIIQAERTNPAFDRSGSHGKGGVSASTLPMPTTQSMQGISPARSAQSPPSPPVVDSKANKRHTLSHTLPDRVHQELEQAENKRNLRGNDIPAGHEMSMSYPMGSMQAASAPVAAVPQPRPRTPPMSGMSRPRTPPMSGMDRPTNGISSTVPAYSPAYKPNQPGPFSGKKSPVAAPRTDLPGYRPTKYSPPPPQESGGAVDIDDALGDMSSESSYQYSTTTTENLHQTDNMMVQDTVEMFHNLNTGQLMTNARTVEGSGGNEHVRAKSVTTRSGMISEDHETGSSLATMETKTHQASVVTSQDGAEEETVTTNQMKAEAIRSTSTTRKESTMNTSGVTDLDAQHDLQNGVGMEGQIVSSQTITSKTRTVETTTYAVEQEGTGTETHIEQKVTIQSDGDPIDHDEALAQAIQEATMMNPDFTVEKIEINQTTQE